jgi:ATP-binding cassette subfamily B protein
VLRGQISGVRVIRAFVRENQEQDRFSAANTDLFTVSLGTGRLMALMFPAVMLVLNLSSIAVLWFGGHLVANGSMQVGALTAFLTYLLQILMSVMMATFMFVMVPRAEVCAERIVEALDTEPDVRPPEHPVGRGLAHGRLELREVDFRYPGAAQPVLHDISMVAEPGQVTAIIGGTGGGKVHAGQPRTEALRCHGGCRARRRRRRARPRSAVLSGPDRLVPQRPYLFSGTVASNLRYEVGLMRRPELWRALESLGA